MLSERLIMKKFLKIAAIISILLALLVGVTFYFVTSIFKEDKEIASNFVKYSSSGVYEQASELMYDALKKRVSNQEIRGSFQNEQALHGYIFHVYGGSKLSYYT